MRISMVKLLNVLLIAMMLGGLVWAGNSIGSIQTSDLGTGSASNSTFLRGDKVWSATIDGPLTSTGVVFSAGVNTTGQIVATGGLNLTGQVIDSGYTQYTGSTTLTTSSPNTVACNNNTATITLQSASTAGAGYKQVVINTASSGNVTVASASNISNAAAVNVIQQTGGMFESDGTHWWRVF